MKSCATYTATIYCGLRPGYTQPGQEAMGHVQEIINMENILKWLGDHCAEIGLGLTTTTTKFVYGGNGYQGSEEGIIVGLINYPRFASSNDSIKSEAIHIAENLLRIASQERVTVVFPDETIMIEKEDLEDK